MLAIYFIAKKGLLEIQAGKNKNANFPALCSRHELFLILPASSHTAPTFSNMSSNEVQCQSEENVFKPTVSGTGCSPTSHQALFLFVCLF